MISYCCPDCRKEYSAIVRCTAEAPSPSCQSSGGTHLHLICTGCGTDDVVLPEAAELAALASLN